MFYAILTKASKIQKKKKSSRINQKNSSEFSLWEEIWNCAYLCPQTRVTGLSRVLRHIGQSKKDSCILLSVFSLFYKFNSLLADISKKYKLLEWIVLILISFLLFLINWLRNTHFPTAYAMLISDAADAFKAFLNL